MLLFALLANPAAGADATHCGAEESVIVSCAIGAKALSGVIVSKEGKELARLACTSPAVQNLEDLQ